MYLTESFFTLTYHKIYNKTTLFYTWICKELSLALMSLKLHEKHETRYKVTYLHYIIQASYIAVL